MVVKIDDPSLIQELKNRFIGFEDNGEYFVDDYQAAYLTELGKTSFDDVLNKVKDDPIYKVFKFLRRSVHVVNYTPDGFLLVHEKGMIPKHSASKYAVWVNNDPELKWEDVKALMLRARAARKVFIIAEVERDNIRFYKISESKV